MCGNKLHKPNSYQIYQLLLPPTITENHEEDKWKCLLYIFQSLRRYIFPKKIKKQVNYN